MWFLDQTGEEGVEQGLEEPEVPTTACFDCDRIIPVSETWTGVRNPTLALCEGCFVKREAKGWARRKEGAR